MAVVNGFWAVYCSSLAFGLIPAIRGELSAKDLLLPEMIRQAGAVFKGPPWSYDSCVLIVSLIAAFILSFVFTRFIASNPRSNLRLAKFGILYGIGVVYVSCLLFLPMKLAPALPPDMTFLSAAVSAFGMMILGGTIFVALFSPIVAVGGWVVGSLNGFVARLVLR